jgi:hypothetical protein
MAVLSHHQVAPKRSLEQMSVCSSRCACVRFTRSANCGVRGQVDRRKHPIATSRIDGREYAVVNVSCFEDIAADRLERSAVAFDDEDETARLARRAAGWIGDVQINGLGVGLG